MSVSEDDKERDNKVAGTAHCDIKAPRTAPRIRLARRLIFSNDKHLEGEASRLTLFRSQRVHPFKTWESREIAIGGVEDRAVFECDGCEHRVHDERTDSLPCPHQPLQNVPVAVAWLQNSYLWLREPRCYRRFRFTGGEWTLEGARIR